MLTLNLHRDKCSNENLCIHGGFAVPYGVDGERSPRIPHPPAHLFSSIDNAPDEQAGGVTTCSARWCSMASVLTESNE